MKKETYNEKIKNSLKYHKLENGYETCGIPFTSFLMNMCYFVLAQMGAFAECHGKELNLEEVEHILLYHGLPEVNDIGDASMMLIHTMTHTNIQSFLEYFMHKEVKHEHYNDDENEGEILWFEMDNIVSIWNEFVKLARESKNVTS